MFSNKNDIAEYLKQHPYTLAPMVDHSDLPFRMLVRKYNAGLCFTPMIHARLFVEDEKYRKKIFVTHHLDRPLVAQIAGCDPDVMLKAVKLLEAYVDIIDINFGCPQGIAKRGNYGSFLLENEKLVLKIVEHLSKNSKIPIGCKIRIFKDKERTLNLVKQIEANGCKLLTVHGRTREQNKDKVGSADWDAIKIIKQILTIPVIANGNIASFHDLKKCLEFTGCDGVMSAEAILEYPALFSNKNESEIIDMDILVQEYLECVETFIDQEHFVKSHLFKMLYTGLNVFTDLREKLTEAKTFEDYKLISKELAERRKSWTPSQKLGWYFRYFKKENASTLPDRIIKNETQMSETKPVTEELDEKIYKSSFSNQETKIDNQHNPENVPKSFSPIGDNSNGLDKSPSILDIPITNNSDNLKRVKID